MSEKPKNTRVYLGRINPYPRDQQLADCKQAVEDLELPAIGRSVYESDEVDLYIGNLRKNEVAVISRLVGLADIKGQGVGIRFLMNVMKIQDKCMYMLDVDTGLRSDAGNEWFDYVEKVARKVMRGRALGKEQSKLMNQIKSAEDPGLQEAWERKKGTREYYNEALVWGNMTITPAETAIKNFSDKELQNASKETIQRIFGGRKKCAEWIKKQSTQTSDCKMPDTKIQEAKLVKVYGKSIWIESDIMGSRHVMVQHEGEKEPFIYCSFHYDYRYTDNASTLYSAESVAVMLGSAEPVEHRRIATLNTNE